MFSVTAFCVFTTAATALLSTSKDGSRQQLGLVLIPAAVLSLGWATIVINRMLVRLKTEQDAHEQSKIILAARTSTVDRLLEFSQTIQGAGRVDQIFATLAYF